MARIDFRGVGSITDLLSFGNVGEVPYTNASSNDFDYSSNLTYKSGTLDIKGEAYTPLAFNNIDTPNGGCRFEVAGNFSQELYINTDYNDITANSKFGIKTSNVQAFLINQFRGVSIGPTDIASNSYVLAVDGNTRVEQGIFSTKGVNNTTSVNTLLTSLDGTELFKVLNNGEIISVNPYVSGAALNSVHFQYNDNSTAIMVQQGVVKNLHLGSNGVFVKLWQTDLCVTGTARAIGTSDFNFRVQGNGQTMLRTDGVNAFVNTSALLEMVSTTKGFLPPRMTTTEKNAITSPATGLIVYDTTTNKLCTYDGTIWQDLY